MYKVKPHTDFFQVDYDFMAKEVYIMLKIPREKLYA